jgi:hypothetical protein
MALVMRPPLRDNPTMSLPDNFYEPSPGPWAFHANVYGVAHTLIDRDGRVLTTNVRSGDGALMAAAPAVVDILSDLLAGVAADDLHVRAEAIMRELARHRPRELRDDDE